MIARLPVFVAFFEAAFQLPSSGGSNQNPVMSKLFYLLAAAMISGWAGCATPNEAPERASTTSPPVDCGPYPENYEQLIKAYFAETLFEPESAHYRIEKPYPGEWRAGRVLGTGAIHGGYFAQVVVRAKNRAGGYLPEKHVGLFIRDGAVLMELSDTEMKSVRPQAPISPSSSQGSKG